MTAPPTDLLAEDSSHDSSPRLSRWGRLTGLHPIVSTSLVVLAAMALFETAKTWIGERFDSDFSPLKSHAITVVFCTIVASTYVGYVLRRRSEGRAAVATARDRFRNLLESSAEGIFEMSGTSRFVAVNQALAELLGYADPEQLIASVPNPAELLADPNDLERIVCDVSLTGGLHSTEVQLRGRDGKNVWVSTTLRALRDDNGEVTGFEGVALDVTDRREASELAARLAAIVQASTDAIFSASLEGTILTWNKGAEDLFGYAAEEIIGKDQDVLVPADRRMEVERERTWVRRGIPAEPFDTVGLCKGGRKVDVWVNVSPIFGADGGVVAAALIFRDVTARKMQEAELREAHRKQRDLLARLLSAQEEERQRLASELHDDPLQMLTAHGLRLEALRRRLDDPETSRMLDQLIGSTSLGIARMRSMLLGLSPRSLETGSLADALREYLGLWGDQSELQIKFKSTLAREPDLKTRAIAYRITVEALANLHKHAHAKQAEISLAEMDGGLHVRIADDGRGISPEELNGQSPGHVGLASIRERAELAGGWASIQSLPACGTVVEFWLPPLGGTSSSKTNRAMSSVALE